MKRTGPVLALACCLLLFPCRRAAGEWTADIVDMETSPSRFVAVDKKAQSFALLSRQSPLRLLAAIPCATGQELGDKFKEGDLKTPEGVYFITRRKTAGLNYELYGDLAFPLNFPNPADVVRRKSGHGIWIHGRGHAIIPYETQGCVALSTPDIHRVDPELAEGMPVVIADEVRLGGEDTARLRDESREVVAATVAWGKAWQDRSPAFFDFHDPEKFAITEGQPFASFKSHKERLFKALPWIQVTLSDIRALAGPDYWVTYFVQVYRSPTLISQGIKRLYWQRAADGRFRIIGMEYEEMPVTLADKGGVKAGRAASPDEKEADTRRPDSPSEEEVQVRQLVSAQQAAMEKVAQKAFHTLNLKPQPTPEDQAILEVAQTGAIRPGVSPFATDAMTPAAPPPPVPAALAVATPAKPAVAVQPKEQPAAPVPAVPAVAVAPAGPVAPVAPAPAVAVQAPAPIPAPAAQPAVVAAGPATAAPAAPVASATAPAASVAPERAAEIAALMEGWRAAWEKGRLDDYMAFYADGARQGDLRGKDAIRRQKEGVWRGREPGRVGIEVVSIVPDGDGFAVVCAEDYQGKGGRPSQGYKIMSLVPSGQKLLIARERWSRNRPDEARLAAAAPAPSTPAAAAPTEAPAPAASATQPEGKTLAAVPAVPATPAPQAMASAGAPASAPAPAGTQASNPAPAAKAPAKADRTAEIASLVEAWRTAWERGRVGDYAGFYAEKAVQGTERGREAIRDQKAGLWKDKAPKRVVLSDVKIKPRKDGFVVTCTQDYESRDGGTDRGVKTLYLAPAGNGFAIVEEKWSRM
uniref:L,D-TPase catalytic domain-containing protein n=1 Tax=Desulfovibrio sp. U5L TaxID=596152 RepID=I2PXA7_9BACT